MDARLIGQKQHELVEQLLLELKHAHPMHEDVAREIAGRIIARAMMWQRDQAAMEIEDALTPAAPELSEYLAAVAYTVRYPYFAPGRVIPHIRARIDTELRLVYCNDEMVEFLGLRREEIVGQRIDVLGAQWRLLSVIQRAVTRAFSNGEPTQEDVHLKERHMRFNALPERDAEGQVCTVLASCYEVEPKPATIQSKWYGSALAVWPILDLWPVIEPLLVLM